MGVLLNEDSPLNDGGDASLNLSEGFGQQGALRSPEHWVTSARYVKQRLIPVLVEAPPLLQYVPGYTLMLATLKTLIEDRATSITGLNSTRTWSHTETLEGNSGEMRETVNDAKIERSVPVFEWPELHNRSIGRYWERSGDLIQMDPDLGHAGVVYLASYQNAENRLPIIEANQSMTVLFIEPNNSMTGVVNAWLCTNMQNKSAGENTGSRVMGEALESPTVSVEFTAITDRSNSVKQMAQDYLDQLNKLGMNPDALATFTDSVSSDVEAAGTGFSNRVAQN